ncbi:hypothetical protein D9613_011323 [Agrocybe pediades]|uniref:Ankyrin repeat protein n=1 Tax=Agrocybe pediades TaxID=84607 RepID=A0A8H4VN08_9AGAR|nr:hypothetical protein D9613_011323 [Agrocybe pediades]
MTTMQHTPEIDAFIARIEALPSGPGVSLDAALQPSLDEESELRKLFATDKGNARLTSPYVGLVDLFAAPASLRTTRARVVQGSEDLSAKYVMPLSNENRRAEGALSTVIDLDEFKRNWSIFTEGSLSQLFDWNNVVAAGGSVLACLAPLDEEDKVSKRAIRKVYHSRAYPTSDVDLFLWGLTPEQAEVKIKTIYEAVRDSVPWDVTCIRTKHTVSIHSQYPYRSVQIVLRLYQSPAEILAGFDIDAPCCAYDGERVWANPRAIVAAMRQCNTVDITRRSPSYEVRLAKYSRRNFEVYVPTLEREKVDPTIYERSIARMEGLARLLVLEKLADDNLRNAFLEGRRQLRGRQTALSRYTRNRRKYKGDLKAETGFGVEMNDYDVASLHIPYGPGWDARRIDKLVYQTDLGMNSTFNPKNKGRRLHRHPAFFGTIQECLEDCCENCPSPIDEDERKLQAEEDEQYVRGRIQFIQEDPGRQSMTGSFKPIDEGEWSEQVYIKPAQELFAAIASHDRTTVQRLISEGIDVNDRDHVGRTTLQVAIISKATDIAGDLIDAGARITARLADGRAPLHLAAQYDQAVIVTKLLERSKLNAEELEKKTGGVVKDEDGTKEAIDRPSSEDDWSSHDDEDVVMSDQDEDSDNDSEDDSESDTPARKEDKSNKEGAATEAEDVLEEDDQPDIIAIDEADWDFGLTPLGFAVLFATLPTLNVLIAAGADVKALMKSNNGPALHPLTLTIVRENQDEACKVAERLLEAGATSSTANENMRTILHAAVCAGRTQLVETLLKHDPHSASVVNFPALVRQNVVFPVVTAINKRHYGVLAILLANDAKLEFEEEDITKAQQAAPAQVSRQLTMYSDLSGEAMNYVNLAYQPLEVALKHSDELSKLLVALGAPVDVGLLQSLSRYSSDRERQTVSDWVKGAWESLDKELSKQQEPVVVDAQMADPESRAEPVVKTGWKVFHEEYRANLSRKQPSATNGDFTSVMDQRNHRIYRQSIEYLEDTRDFLAELRDMLLEKNAKSWKELHPKVESNTIRTFQVPKYSKASLTNTMKRDARYVNLGGASYEQQNVAQHLVGAYDELFEACYSGNHDTINRLCLPKNDNETLANLKSIPLNISVRLVDAGHARYDATGYTPLFAAIAARRWSTAKLILAIATAQYHPANEKDKIKFDNDIEMDSDSDEEYDSDESDITVEQEEIKFIDIATRSSAIQSEVHPRTMLKDVPVYWRSKTGDSGQVQAHLLAMAVLEHDLDAFVHIADLYKTLPQPLDIGEDVFTTILNQDQPEIMNEYIRRTGAGINVAHVKKDSGDAEIPVITNDANKIYLGLNVHGEKRMDLAKKNDPDAVNTNNQQEDIPIVWQAARNKSAEIVKYLASNRPLEAYKFYSMSSSSSKALWLRQVLSSKNGTTSADLEKKISEWLGWGINSLGESPLAAGILSHDLNMIKLLAKLRPELFKESLQTKFKFIGVNALFFAIRIQSQTPIVEYLLSRNLSPAERDTNKRWNIYHHICDLNNGRLLKYFLEKLPRDVNEELLLQQSKPRLNTPLHVAVKNGNKTLVQILLDYSKPTVLKRDVDGKTPFHCAVKQNLSEIAQQLLAVSPPEVLFMEDAVGNTPVEVVTLAQFTEQFNKYKNNVDNVWGYSPEMLRPCSLDTNYGHPPIFPGPKEGALSVMKEVVQRLAKDEVVREKIKADVILEWIAKTEVKARKFKERSEKWKKQEEEENAKMYTNQKINNAAEYLRDTGDLGKTYKVVRDAVAALPETAMRRHLIHVLDVQASVNATLNKVASKQNGDEDEEDDDDNYRYENWRRRRLAKYGVEGELGPGEDEEKKARKSSIVLQCFSMGRGGDQL